MIPPSFSSFPVLESHSKSSSEAENRGTKDRALGSGKSKSSGKRKHKKLKDKAGAKNVDTAYRISIDEKGKVGEHESVYSAGATRLFYVDQKGDPLNLQYGGLHARDIPRYRPIDRGRSILGVPHGWVALQRGSGIEVTRFRKKLPGLTDSKSRVLLAAPPTRRITQASNPQKYEEVDGFLRLSSGRQPHSTEQSYRSITLPKRDDNSDSESSPSSNDDDGGGSGTESDSDTLILTAHQETLKHLGEQVTADPSSTETWLLLLSHTLSTIPESSKNAFKARSEITLSVLGRALAADPRNGASKWLRLKYLKAGEALWHESKLRAEWEEALKERDAGVQLEWLEWRMGKGNRGIDGIVEDVVRVLGMLDHSEQSEIVMLRIFWRVAVVFQKAGRWLKYFYVFCMIYSFIGYSERATAMFQAQAELMYRLPPSLHGIPFQSQLDLLEEFWDSEMPRVGEEGAQGWANWLASNRQQQPPKDSIKFSQSITDLDPYRQWAAQELQADLNEAIPARSTQESFEESDPYSVVLFNDIRSFLMDLHSPSLKHAFRLTWLSFLGLHVPGFSDSLSGDGQVNWDDRWNNDHLERSSYLKALFLDDIERTYLATDAVAGVIVGREKEYVSGFGPAFSWGNGVLGPLEVPASCKLLKGSGKMSIWEAKHVEGLNERFVRSVFAQLRQAENDFEWDVLALAFEAATNIKSALKLSRSFLSLQRESMSHWSAHAYLERFRGRTDDARKVYQTVLVASASKTAKGVATLWWDWAEMEWLEGAQEQALNVILRSVGTEGRSGVVILRARGRLEDAARKEHHDKEREAWIKLRALLDLLTTKEPSGPLKVFDEYLSGADNNINRERLIVASLFMVYHHGIILKNPMPPLILRERAAKGLDEYPDNSLIMGFFLEGEKGQGIWGRIRERLGDNGGGTKSVFRRISEVWIAGWERGRWKSEIERTRSGLAAAVDSERTRSSHVVWRVYLEFEIRAGQLQRAKKLLFRAIGECPLVKELYLLAFGPLRSVFSARELKGMAEMMVERGLRLRRGLDEGLIGWTEMEPRDGNSSDISKRAPTGYCVVARGKVEPTWWTWY